MERAAAAPPLLLRPTQRSSRRRVASAASASNGAGPRVGHVERVTKETRVSVTLNLDGTGRCSAASGIPFLDHMLDVRVGGARQRAALTRARPANREPWAD